MVSVILTILMILLVPLGLFLIAIILLQESKSGGLSGAFGGTGETILGARAGRELSRWTMWGTAVFVVMLITIGILCNHQQSTSRAERAATTEAKKEAGASGTDKPVEGDAKGATPVTPVTPVTPETPETKTATPETPETPAIPATPETKAETPAIPVTPETKPAEGAPAATTPATPPDATPEKKAEAPATPPADAVPAAPATPAQPTDTQGGEKK